MPRPLLAWLAVVGLVMGVLTLGIIEWADDPHGIALARTLGFTAFSLTHVAFAFATKDEEKTIFDLDTLSDRPLLVWGGASIAAIILATTFGPFQRLLGTVELELGHWLVCIGAALIVLAVAEIRKLVLVRRRSGGAAITTEERAP